MKDKRIAFRIEPGVKPQLEAAAEADQRTLSSLLAKIVADWLQQQSTTQGKATNVR